MKKQTTPLLCLLLSLVFLLLLLLLLCHGEAFIKSGFKEEEEQKDQEEVRRSMFPPDFLFGTATSAYQIEGGYLEDGKGLSNWDVFSHIPGNVHNGDNGDIADDHYHRYMEDIENMQSLGVNAYRFSISWSRILPKGRFGEVNPNGVMFYNSIIDNLLLRGIQPFVTIYHSDVPQELEDRYGSWLSPQIQEDFVRFAKICFEKFGDRVKYWSTINEANGFILSSYMNGIGPPRRCSPPFGNCSTGNSDLEPLIAAHNVILSHAKAVKLYREQFQAKQSGTIGIVLHCTHYVPYRNDVFSIQAVDRAFAFSLAWILDPLIYGDYPSEMRKYLGNDLPKFDKEEAKLVKGSIEFVGINHYSTLYAVDCFHYPTDCTAGQNRSISGFVSTTGYRDGVPIGDETGYKVFFVVPSGLEKLMDHMRVRYSNVTIYITENGYTPQRNASLYDFKRVKYHKEYLAALAKAIRKGAKVKGYFVWTFMDNFEWTLGYDASYGLYYVDRRTLKRSPKLSAKWYAHFLTNEMDHHAEKFTIDSFVVKNNVVASTS